MHLLSNFYLKTKIIKFLNYILKMKYIDKSHQMKIKIKYAQIVFKIVKG